MVELNFDRRRPPALLDLTRVPELATWDASNGEVRLGAGVTYTRVIDELGTELPGLAMASRTVGSPQIRNRGTVGGNLGAASPAGDAHPALLAAYADVELSSAERHAHGCRSHEFYTGVKKHVGRPDELITAVWSRRARAAAVQQDRHPQRDGDRGRRVRPRPASRARGQVGTGIGSAAPTPRRATRGRGVPRQRELPTGSRARPVPDVGVRGVRQAGRRRGLADRRRPRHRGVPPARAGRDGPALPGPGRGRHTGEEAG